MDLRVLIADDAPFIHEVLAAHLSKRDVHIVAGASNGDEAVSLALSHKPDLIFMDMAMPNRNGIEATKKILSLLPETNIVGMSSMADERLIVEAIEAGCVDFLSKSFKVEELNLSVANVRARVLGAVSLNEKESVNG